MPDNAEQSKRSESQGDLLKDHAVGDRSGFGLLAESILQSLPIGIVAFDPDLKILRANADAAKLIELGDYIDKSLAKGTDDKIWQGWTQQLTSAISTRKPCVFDDISYKSDGKTKLFRIVCAPLEANESAKCLGGIIIVEDVTERIDLQRRLANAERLAAVGKHASKVAHELNNPLDGILRYINLAWQSRRSISLSVGRD